MEKNTQFRIDSVEELIGAYEMFGDRWTPSWSLDDEIKYFKKGCNHIICDEENRIGLYYEDAYKVIPSPLKQNKEKDLIKQLKDYAKTQGMKVTVIFEEL